MLRQKVKEVIRLGTTQRSFASYDVIVVGGGHAGCEAASGNDHPQCP